MPRRTFCQLKTSGKVGVYISGGQWHVPTKGDGKGCSVNGGYSQDEKKKKSDNKQ